MATKWKKRLSVLVLWLWFFLLLVSLVGSAITGWNLIPRDLGPADAFRTDYQDTAYFRRLLTDYFYSLYNHVERNSFSDPWHGASVDPNLLYQAVLRTEDGFTYYFRNTTHALSRGLPEGFNFLLVYENGRVTITKDGEELDVYGNGYHTSESLWDLPGYLNDGTASQSSDGITIYLAAAAEPIDTGWWEPMWAVVKDLQYVRYGYLGLFGAWAGTLLCLTLSVTLRKVRQEARADLAKWTAKVWFEVKLAAVFLPLLVFWPSLAIGFFWGNGGLCAILLAVLLALVWPPMLYLVGCDLRHNPKPWRNSLCARLLSRGCRAAGALSARQEAAARLAGRVWFEWKVLAVLCYLPAAFWALRRLQDRFGWFHGSWGAVLWLLLLAVLFLGYIVVLYLVACDLRRNPKPWRHGLFATLGRGLSRLWGALRSLERARPFRQRFILRIAAAALGAGLLALAAYGVFFGWCYDGTSLSWPAAFLLALLLTLLLLSPLAWLLDRVWVLLRDLCRLLDHLSALRAGAAPAPLALPEGSDLGEAAGDLNGLQDGLQKAVEDRMKSERMKVELIANVSHDLKTPLTSVVSYAELLGEEEDLPPHVRDYIRILNDKARRLQVMVQDVFEVSKAASGELPLRLERLDLGRLLAQTLADMDEAIAQSGLQLRTALPGAPVWITADGDRLYRVFQNLLQNALQYALAGSRVYVSLEVQSGWAEASVKNTSREELPAGVDFTARFVRGDASRTDGGSGLGLAIASSFAAACGGSLLVETDADLFTARVRFPLSEDEAEGRALP